MGRYFYSPADGAGKTHAICHVWLHGFHTQNLPCPSLVCSCAELVFNIDRSTPDKPGQPPLCNYSHDSSMPLISNSPVWEVDVFQPHPNSMN